MIKRGDKAKGFRFDDSSGVHYNKEMEKMVGKTGTIYSIGTFSFTIVFEDSYDSWNYPVKEYLAIQREERLKEIGI